MKEKKEKDTPEQLRWDYLKHGISSGIANESKVPRMTEMFTIREAGQPVRFAQLTPQQREAIEAYSGNIGSDSFEFSKEGGKLHANVDPSNTRAMAAWNDGEIEQGHMVWDQNATSAYTGERGDWVPVKDPASIGFGKGAPGAKRSY